MQRATVLRDLMIQKKREGEKVNCYSITHKPRASQAVLVVKNPPANAGDRHKRLRFDPWVGKIPGRGHGNPRQCSSLENPMDRGAWLTTVPGVSMSWTQLKQLNTHIQHSMALLLQLSSTCFHSVLK